MIENPALSDHRLDGFAHQVVRTGRVGSLEEAAEARGVKPPQVVKTMVIRRGTDDYLFVLVPGDRVISWPKLRRHLGVNRVSMPGPDEAFDATGYPRGAITPLGAKRAWPVLADSRLGGIISLGGGDHGVSITADASPLLDALHAERADVTDEA